MADRSIVVKLKADIGDLKSKMSAASASIKGLADQSAQVGAKSGAALGKIGTGLSKGLDGVEKHKQALHTVGAGFTVLGLAAAAGVGVAVKSFADFDEAISHVKATGSDAAGNIDALRQAALKAGADTKYSATEAAQGVEALLKAGVSAQEVLSGGLDGALSLAASGNLDVASSAEVAASAMTQFGLKGSQVPHVADLLAAAAGKAQGEVSDMGAALNQSGLVAAGFGLSIEETVGSLAAFASAGLIGSDAGTSFKTMIQRLQNPTDEAAGTMKQLGLNVYDAQGQFVGMTAFAEQLKTQLSGLTDEQRNAALATIFGADAIRGANVLYKEGGAGISDWVGKVNDSGFAAEQAAARMDNLKGDFEQLTGSIETGLIQSGSGANDFLRSLTQGATDAVNAFGKLPSGVQQGALGVTAIVAAAGLGIGALSKLAVAAVETRAALASMNITAAGTAARLAPIATAVAIVVGAMAALKAAGTGVNAVLANSKDFNLNPQSLGDAGKAIDGLGSAIDGTTPSLDKFFTLSTSADIFGRTDIDSLSDAFDRLGNQGAIGKASDGITGFLGQISGVKSGAELVEERFDQLDQSLTTIGATSAPKAAAAFSDIAASATKQGVPIERLISLFPQYQAQLKGQADALGVTTLSAQDYADWMGGKVPAAITAAAKANPQAAAAFDATSGAVEKQTASVQDSLASLYAYAGAMDAISASAGGAEEAIDAANASIKGGTHDQGTKQGRTNQAALDNVGGKSRDSLSALATGGASQAALDKTAAGYRKAYRQIAEDIGYSGKAAKAFADDLIATPKAVNVRIVTAGAKVSADQAAVLNHELKSIPEEQRARIVTIAETKGAKAAQAAIERVKDKKVIARADGETGGAKKVAAAMKALKDRLVLAKARGDKKGAQDVKEAMDRLKNRTVTARANAQGTAEVRNLQGAVNRLTGKTINIRVVTTKSTRVADNDKADGGLIDTLYPAFDGGGTVQGVGGPRQDNIAGIDRATGMQTSWVSVGEMVTNARSTANNFGALSTINANPDKRYGLVELADGGVPRWAKGSTDSDVANVIRLQRNVDEARNLAELAKALKAQEKATKSLTSAEQTAVEAIRQLSTTLQEPYRSKSTDVDDVLEQMRQGFSDLSTFGSQLKSLKAAGLSQGVIDQISSQGAVNGSELASQILAGGQDLVYSLNLANANLEAAALAVGTNSEGIKPPPTKKPKKKAYGGPIWGGSGNREDDVPVDASGGEFMIQEPVARSNMALLHALNAGRSIAAYANATTAARPASYDQRSWKGGDVTLQYVGDPEAGLRKARNEQRTSLVMARLTTPLF